MSREAFEDDTSSFLRHELCPKCRENGGDSDNNNLARYTDGHGYCFACHYHEPGTGTEGGEGKNSSTSSSFHRLDNPLDVEPIPLTKRGITQETCRKFGYGVSTYRGLACQVANYRAQDGHTLVAQHVRLPGKEFRWVGDASGVQLFGQHLWRKGGKRIVITEGEIDCLSVSQMQDNKWPVVSLPNGAGSAKKHIAANLEWLESFDKVVLAFDMDEPGRQAAEECASLFGVGKVCIAELPAKDANEALTTGRTRECINALWDARSWRPDGIRAGSELWEDLLKPPPVGFDTPYPGLNRLLRGLRCGELYLFTAGSGIGKSTIVNEIAYAFKMRHNLPLGIMALEENPVRNARRYLGIHLNKPLHLPEGHAAVDTDELRQAFEEVMGDGRWFVYDHFGSSDIDTLLAKLRYMAVGLGCKVIVLDHISIVVSGLTADTAGESERRTIDLLMTRLRQLVEETGVMVLAVVHLKRPDKGKSYNEGRQVSLTDLRGSGALEQLSDAVISLERNQQGDDPDRALLRVLKNRPTGECGEAGFVRYRRDTGRLLADGESEAGTYGFTAEGNSNQSNVNENEDF